MIHYFTHKSNRIAVKLAITCFSIGSLLFILLLTTNSHFIITMSFLFFILYGMSNLIMLIVILINMLLNYKDLQQHFTALIIMLLNVPIATGYLYLLT